MTAILKQRRHESRALRDSARGQPCQVRIPGVCNNDPATTILAHINGGGMGTKVSDLFGAFCCSSCHDLVDSRVRHKIYSGDDIELMHRQGVQRTQQYFLDSGLVELK